MPTYEYECEKCKKTFELFQSMKDAALTTCPKAQCRRKTWGKGKVRRLLGAGAGLIFKGSGFYITDYRGAGYAESAKKDSADSAANPQVAKSEKPADTAPAANREATSQAAPKVANRHLSKKETPRRESRDTKTPAKKKSEPKA